MALFLRRFFKKLLLATGLDSSPELLQTFNKHMSTMESVISCLVAL